MCWSLLLKNGTALMFHTAEHRDAPGSSGAPFRASGISQTGGLAVFVSKVAKDSL